MLKSRLCNLTQNTYHALKTRTNSLFSKNYHQNLINKRAPIRQNAKLQQEETYTLEELIHPAKNQPPLPSEYVLFYRNTKARFFKFATVASIINAISMTILAYLTMTMVKYNEIGEKQEASLLQKSLIGLGFGFAAIGVIAGAAYYAKHNILEMGKINQDTIRIVTAKFGFNNYQDLRIPAKDIKIMPSSIDNLRMDLFLNDNTVSKSPSSTQIKQMKGKGDYVFVGIKGRKWNHIMDVTADSIYLDKNSLLHYIEQHPRIISRSSDLGTFGGFSPYKN
ncbi:hypothetical protein ABK040_008814 [Willaertia magna]